mmetsp:Transcript_18786/g.34652  ORF Transcript_18786/g.34652 Transcript_18786/m.34652 type:complete len:290 (+) Transcript_18786:120-989(+)
MVTNTQKLLLAAPMSFIAGYVDAITIARFSIFASMHTGNLLKLGQSMLGGVDYFWIIVVTLSRSVGIFTLQMLESRYKYGTTIVTPFLFVAILGMESVHYLHTFVLQTEELPYNRKWEVCVIAVVFGVQAAVSMHGCVKSPTSMATGHLNKLTGACVKIANREHVDVSGLLVSVIVVMGICSGALAGNVLNRVTQGTVFGEFLLTPTTLVFCLLIVMDDVWSSPQANSQRLLDMVFEESDESKIEQSRTRTAVQRTTYSCMKVLLGVAVFVGCYAGVWWVKEQIIQMQQ